MEEDILISPKKPSGKRLILLCFYTNIIQVTVI